MGLLHLALFHRRRRYRTRRTITVELSFPTVAATLPDPPFRPGVPAGWDRVDRMEVERRGRWSRLHVWHGPQETVSSPVRGDLWRAVRGWLDGFEVDQAAGTAVRRRGT